MRTQCERNASASAGAYAMGDAEPHASGMPSHSSELKAQKTARVGLSSPNPSLEALEREVLSILQGGIDSLDLNDFGRPWPSPNRSDIRHLVATCDRDLCLKAAREAREIVQSQDRAPNIAALFAKKLRDLTGVREAIRHSLASAEGGNE